MEQTCSAVGLCNNQHPHEIQCGWLTSAKLWPRKLHDQRELPVPHSPTPPIILNMNSSSSSIHFSVPHKHACQEVGPTQTQFKPAKRIQMWKDLTMVREGVEKSAQRRRVDGRKQKRKSRNLNLCVTVVGYGGISFPCLTNLTNTIFAFLHAMQTSSYEYPLQLFSPPHTYPLHTYLNHTKLIKVRLHFPNPKGHPTFSPLFFFFVI